MAETPKEPGTPHAAPLAKGTQTLGAGLTMAVSVGLFTWGGHLLDGVTATAPLFVLLGALVGMVGGMIHLITVVAPGLLPFRRRNRDEPPEDNG